VPTGYVRSVDKSLKPVEQGDKRPAWQTTTNPFQGGGKETGIQNVHISNQLQADGLMLQDEWGQGHSAVVRCV
jgi:hypothetical protein